MITCYSIAEYSKAIASFSDDTLIGFVPTMGALHKGHISLVQRARDKSQIVVVSVFVNPTQFNNHKDLESYPRNLAQDATLLERAGTDILFAPSVEEMYPNPDSRVFELGGLDNTGEGRRRPGHFNGVAQIVTKLFDIIKPKYAFFGEKDFQQLSIIKYITAKQGYPVNIIPCPTLREDDGLAMSSRNLLLTNEHREAAPEIYRSLQNAATLAKKGTHSPRDIAEITKKEIEKQPLLKVEYVEPLDSLTMEEVDMWEDAADIQLCVALFAGEVRLIDNIKIEQNVA